MLTKRTQILLDDNLWRVLTTLAHREQISVGELIRTAVKEKYVVGRQIKKQRRKAYKRILAVRPHLKGEVDYRELISAGRKF